MGLSWVVLVQLIWIHTCYSFKNSDRKFTNNFLINFFNLPNYRNLIKFFTILLYVVVRTVEGASKMRNDGWLRSRRTNQYKIRSLKKQFFFSLSLIDGDECGWCVSAVWWQCWEDEEKRNLSPFGKPKGNAAPFLFMPDSPSSSSIFPTEFVWALKWEEEGNFIGCG